MRTGLAIEHRLTWGSARLRGRRAAAAAGQGRSGNADRQRLQVGPAPPAPALRRTREPAPIGSRAWPTASPRWRIIALVGSRVRCVVAGLEGEALEHAGVDEPGTVDVALRPTGRTSAGGPRPSSASPRRPCRRRRTPAAAASSRRRRCRPRTRRARTLMTAAVSPGLPAASLSADDVRDLTGEAQQRRRGDLAAGAHRDVVDHRPAGRWHRRSRACAPRCRPATGGCSTGTRRGCRRRRASPPRS